MRHYHAAYYEIEDGWFMAEVMDYLGVVSQGRTLRSARQIIRDALRTMIECHVESGEPLPVPNPRAKPTEGLPAFWEEISVEIRARTGGVP